MSTTQQRTDHFRMPALGADMTEGRVVEWLVAEGDAVDRGELVAVVETDKSDIEIEVFEPCTFEEFLVELHDDVQVGDPIARITLAADAAPLTIAPQTEQVITTETTETTVTTAEADERSRRRISPRARRLAAERGVDLDAIDTTKVVTGTDVIERTSTVAEAAPRPSRDASMRRAIATLMERSWTEIPHYHVATTLDLTDVRDRLEAANAERDVGDRVVLGAVVNLAIARAAARIQAVNGWWIDDAFSPATDVDLGLILSLRTGGIVAPTIPAADRLEPTELMHTMRDLVERARRGRLREGDLRPASISVTNMGDLGADSVLGIIYPPQVTLVGVGTPRWRPSVIDGDVVPRWLAELTVAGDHRAHDGLIAARLVRTVADLLEELP